MFSQDIGSVSFLRRQVWHAGFRPVPVFNHDANVDSPGKQPLGRDWHQAALKDPPFCATSPAVPHALNTGILCNGLGVIDIDVDLREVAAKIRAIAFETFGEAPMRYRDNSPRVLIPYRAAQGEPPKRSVVGPNKQKVEVLGHGQQFVAFGVHPSGAELKWMPQAPGEVSFASLPAITEAAVTEFLNRVAPIIGALPPAKCRPGSTVSSLRGFAADQIEVAEALSHIPNNGPADWEEWNRIGMATWAAMGGSETGRDAFVTWSELNDAYDPIATNERWEHYATSPPTKIGAGTLFYLARQMRQEDPSTADAGATGGTAAELGTRAIAAPAFAALCNPAEVSPATLTDTLDLQEFDLTEDGAAQAFATKHGHELRYDHTAGCWYRWTGLIWQCEKTKLAFSWARMICRQLAREQRAKGELKAKLAKAATAAAVERFAQSDRIFAVTSEIWDRDPFLLGTPAGTVDLRTGNLGPAVQSDYITKMTAVAPAETADCPQWLEFLDAATAHNTELIRFLQQWSGYSLTGDTREQELLAIFGPGGTGKSVLLNVLSGIISDYCRTAAMDTLMASQSDKHPTDLAALKGARMVCCSEVEEGRAWAEVRIKQLTGGDTITARFMRQDFFDYKPQFKLAVIGNHKPILRNVDEAARRRFDMVPFTHKPPVPDRKLESKLRVEWPAILRWMIDGCLDWQINGFVRPQVVLDATAGYFSEQDLVRQWIDDCCETGDLNIYDTSANLYQSWSEYALANGEKPGSGKSFAQALSERGCKSMKKVPGKRTRGWERIRVRLPSTDTLRGMLSPAILGRDSLRGTWDGWGGFSV
jgi:putative DNA primase/helicase